MADIRMARIIRVELICFTGVSAKFYWIEVIRVYCAIISMNGPMASLNIINLSTIELSLSQDIF